jgi:hypothetical protein
MSFGFRIAVPHQLEWVVAVVDVVGLAVEISHSAPGDDWLTGLQLQPLSYSGRWGSDDLDLDALRRVPSQVGVLGHEPVHLGRRWLRPVLPLRAVVHRLTVAHEVAQRPSRLDEAFVHEDAQR